MSIEVDAISSYEQNYWEALPKDDQESDPIKGSIFDEPKIEEELPKIDAVDRNPSSTEQKVEKVFLDSFYDRKMILANHVDG